MAKLKVKTKEDSTLVRLDSLQYGEVYLMDGVPYMRAYQPGCTAVNLTDGSLKFIGDEAKDTLVTYVKSAELKLTI